MGKKNKKKGSSTRQEPTQEEQQQQQQGQPGQQQPQGLPGQQQPQGQPGQQQPQGPPRQQQPQGQPGQQQPQGQPGQQQPQGQPGQQQPQGQPGQQQRQQRGPPGQQQPQGQPGQQQPQGQPGQQQPQGQPGRQQRQQRGPPGQQQPQGLPGQQQPQGLPGQQQPQGQPGQQQPQGPPGQQQPQGQPGQQQPQGLPGQQQPQGLPGQQQPQGQPGQQQRQQRGPPGQQQPQGQPGQQQPQGQPGQQQPQGQPGWQQRQQRGPPGQQQPQGQPGQQQPQGQPGQQQPQGQPGWQQRQQRGPPGQQQPQGQPGQQQPQGQPGRQQRQRGPPGQQQPQGQPGQQQPQGQPGQQQRQQQGPPGQQQPQGQPGQQRPASQPRPPTRNVPAKVDDVIITKGVKGLSLKVPPRKNLLGGGTLGRKTIIETNHLALDINRAKNNKIIHYDVTVNPDKPKRLIRLVMEQFRSENYPNRYPAFDGKKNLYSSGYLPFQTHISGTVVIQDEERRQPKEFEVTINFANMVNLDQLKTYMKNGSSQEVPMEVIQAVDIVLREASATSKCFVQVGRSFFTPPSNQIIDLGEGLELWYGFYQSAILGWRPFVNIDVAHKGFPKQQTVVNLIGDLFRCDPRNLKNLRPFEVDDLNKYLKTLKVDYELPGQPDTKRCYRVNRVVDSPIKLSFLLKNGQKISVFDYFLREKRLKLQFPDLPCLDVGSPNRQSPIYVPVELCTIKSQVIVRKMTENQTSNMIKHAATSADIRKHKIMDALRKAGFNSSRTVQEFGFSVSDQFEKVSARILDAPSLAYKDGVEKPMRGVWRAKHFLTGSDLKDWGILNLNGRYTQDDKLRSFCADMKKWGESLGMSIAQARPPCTIDCHPRDVQRGLEDYLNKVKGIQLVVVVVPDRGDTYAKVKQAAELRVGVLTQCVRARTMNRMNPSTICNILLKVNSKLNGVNHSLDNSARPPCLLRPVMIVGADVTHPSPDQTDIPSVAAVCASHDAKAFRYNIQYRLQGPREEIIRDLQNIMKEHLMFFYKQTNHKPEKIIFYRDGVSEGQFAQVLNEELQAIRRACQSLSADYQPKITFLVVQKRHHTRFFPLKREDMDGKNGNVPPGTVVDTEITHPTEMDFYLVSHASIQGTSRPTKYRKLWDDSEMSEDEVEQLTYYLCHMFSRCTRAVSYPTPTYYAHLAAYRARVYIEGQKIQLNNLLEEQKRRSIQEVICRGSPMFFV